MSPRDYFVLAIRIFGLWEIPAGVGNLANFANLKLGLYPMSTTVEPNGYLLIATFDLALAALFLFGARKIASWCDEGTQEPTKSSADGDLA